MNVRMLWEFGHSISECLQILKPNFGVFLSWLDGDEMARFAENSGDMHRLAARAQPSFKNDITWANAQSGDENAGIFGSNGLGSPLHASDQFGKAWRQMREYLRTNLYFFSKSDVLNGCFRVEDSNSLNLHSFIDQRYDVNTSTFLDQCSDRWVCHDCRKSC